MTDERWHELMDSEDSELTSDEAAQGWHWCWEYDGLLVGPPMPLDYCSEWGSDPNECMCGYTLEATE